MEKYGFVYIWFDSWRKMYYVGSHWGTEKDGYICSSKRMRDAYRRRPDNFKRRILKRIYSSKQDVLNEEYRYLSTMNTNELGKKYYNLTNHKNGHWATIEETAKTLSEKISIRTKEAMNRDDVREKYLKGLETRDTRSSDTDVREKRRQSMIGKNVGKDNSKAIAISAEMRRGKKLSEEHKQKIKDTSHFSVLNNTKKTCVHCGFISTPAAIGRYHNERCRKINGS